MADIGEFADQAAANFGVLQDTMRSKPELYKMGGLPTSREAASMFIRAAYYASLIPDEGRYPETCLMCYRADQAFRFCTLFEESLEATATEIAKLSHAIDSRSHIACIGEKDAIRIQGFQVNMLFSQREYGYSSGRIANPLKVRIKGPGNIEVSCGGLAMVFRSGEISTESPVKRSRSMERLVARITDALRKAGAAVVESLDSVFNDLMREIVRLGHGGLVIFSGGGDGQSFSSLRRTTCNSLPEALGHYWEAAAALNKAAGGIDGLLNLTDHTSISPQKMNLATATDRLENCLPAIANLSGMDGAIVINFDCTVAAFNAIIDRKAKPESEPKLIDVNGNAIDYRKAFAHKGSRHQSALLYAQSVRDSFVFVISQDGSITAFHNPGNGSVICEFGLRPME